MAAVIESSKAKIAVRVIEIFEYFDREHPSATVMDIVRRYGRPQSSTSELLSSLAEMGLLYKEPRSRSYWPTPRLAMVGANTQPAAPQAGLCGHMDDLARSTRHHVALFGVVGASVQVFHWSRAPGSTDPHMRRGSSEALSETAAGQLLISSYEADYASRLIRRLYAEADPETRFGVADLNEKVRQFGRQGYATGVAGFLAGHMATAVLLPRAEDNRPLALACIYTEGAVVDTSALVGTLERIAVRAANPEDTPAVAAPFIMAI